MGKDIKKMFAAERVKDFERRPDHETLFTERLKQEFPKKKNSSYIIYALAASLLLLIGLSITTYMYQGPDGGNTIKTHSQITLSTLSPALEQIEQFYVTSIDLALIDIKNNTSNSTLINRYMRRYSHLQEEFQRLQVEMNEEGPNSLTINALIENFKLQLELLNKLKAQLSIKSNEKSKNI